MLLDFCGPQLAKSVSKEIGVKETKLKHKKQTELITAYHLRKTFFR